MNSWTPINLAELDPAPPRRPTISDLLYPGARHAISGEPDSGKSLIMLALACREVRAGNHVVWTDLEGDAQAMLERASNFGLADAELARILYIKPAEPINLDSWTTIAELLDTHQPTVVFFDALVGLLDLHDLNGERGPDVERAFRAVVEPWRSRGAAIVLCDHVVKNRDNRGRFAAGSERKLGAVDVHIGVDLAKPFSRGQHGSARVLVHKDRAGFHQRGHWGTFELSSDDDGRNIMWTLNPGGGLADDTEGDWRPTFLMERVSRFLEGEQRPVSRTAIASNVVGKRTYLFTAIKHLIGDGHAVENDDERISIATPYRDGSSQAVPAENNGRGSPSSPGSQAVPEPVPGLGHTPSSPSSPLSGGGTGNWKADDLAERLLERHADIAEGGTE